MDTALTLHVFSFGTINSQQIYRSSVPPTLGPTKDTPIHGRTSSEPPGSASVRLTPVAEPFTSDCVDQLLLVFFALIAELEGAVVVLESTRTTRI